MPSWFSTKGRLFGGATGQPQHFELHCPCGRTLEGARTRGPQVAVCPECDRLHFVLPASPFPEPKEKPARRLPGLGPEAGEGEATGVLGTDPAMGPAGPGGYKPPPTPPAIPPVSLPRVVPGGGPVVPRRADDAARPLPRTVEESGRGSPPRPVEGAGQGAGAGPHPLETGRGPPPRRGHARKTLPRQNRESGRQREIPRGPDARPPQAGQPPAPDTIPGTPVFFDESIFPDAEGQSQPGGQSTPKNHAAPPVPGVRLPATSPSPTEAEGVSRPSTAETGSGARSREREPRESARVTGAGTEGRATTGDADARLQLPQVPARRAKWRIRLALLASLGLLGLGGTWLWNLHTHRQAVATFDRELPLAEQALSQGDLLTAAEHYQPVLTALQRLGRNDARGLKIRQTARETVAMAGLCSTGLPELFAEASAAEGLGAGVWQGMFRRQYQGQWIVLDVPLRRMSGGEIGYRLDCPVHPQGEAVRLTCDLPDLHRVSVLGEESRRVVFAGQLRACRPPEVGDPIWVLELDPATAFLWLDSAGLQKLGFPTDDRLLAVLRDQAQVVGVEP